MKKVSLLLGLIFLISAFTSQGQIVTKYQQGFEATGETSSYTVVQGSAVPVTTVASSGERSLKLSQSTSSEVIIMLDTLDFTDNGSFQHFYLDFMHICDVDPVATASVLEVATIQIRLASETDAQWLTFTGNDHYDNSWGGGSTDFVGMNSFSMQSYSTWMGTTINNTHRKRRDLPQGKSCHRNRNNEYGLVSGQHQGTVQPQLDAFACYDDGGLSRPWTHPQQPQHPLGS